MTIDKNGRPEAIKTTSGTATLIDLTYGYKNSAGKDTTKIRTRTDNLTKYKTTYDYDSQDRLRYTLEADSAGARRASWLYCWDKAGNLTSQDGSKNACPGGTTYTYDDASELTGKNGSTTGWSYDKLGNETAGASTTARTNEAWTDYSQLSAITAGGKSYDLVHAGTDNSERAKLGSTWFHHTALGLASTTTSGVDTGFIREPAGTLNSMTTGGKSYYYLTDHGQRPRPGRRHGQAHAHLFLRPHGPAPRHHHRGSPPAAPLRGHVSGPHGPVQDGPPLLRPHPRPLHPTRPVGAGNQPLPLRRR
ncbi:hypothetical protein [Streptomyces massasporeus]|uniref:hypothetical protein n=1 Tax=Streptomyces massasporeus TaxID=67324 RepID=UPI00199B0D4F|nr:hypothetical protein [Streptomyces massasporeus]GGV91416.1 hypothetical protein GCM10010228_81760 [Streptomyces massasporeus]